MKKIDRKNCGLTIGRCKAALEELEAITETNPYPESVFLPVTEEQLKRLEGFCMEELGFPLDRYNGQICREMWPRWQGQIKDLLKKHGGM